MKIFTTQLHGLFQKIIEKEEDALEDGARLLAQGPAGTGSLYVIGLGAMKGVADALASHPDAPDNTAHLNEQKRNEAGAADRVLIIADKADDAFYELLAFFEEAAVPMVIAAPFIVEDVIDVVIYLHVRDGLIPAEDGSRYGSPAALCAMFIGQLLFLGVKDMLEELEE
ncbi:DUF2529 family protein [Alteribacillus sp. HJP-4]|uniref:DUF2529 family protein n=1 Tax=Alteribacillus sp. HJP-4 TaxID=2775394 RepID=UPI0035CCECEA